MLANHKNVHEAFFGIFNTLPKIQFSATWKNNTEYLDNIFEELTEDYLQHSLKLIRNVNGGYAVSFVDDFGRRGVFFLEAGVAVVVFERYPGDVLLVGHANKGLTAAMQKFWSSRLDRKPGDIYSSPVGGRHLFRKFEGDIKLVHRRSLIY